VELHLFTPLQLLAVAVDNFPIWAQVEVLAELLGVGH
jgi:hypothetical protein